MPFNGARLKQWRTEAKLTQFQLSVLTNTPNDEPIRPEYLSSYENGHRSPNIDHFMRLCSATSLTPDQLWTSEVRTNAV